jgi:hypothetical protein
MKRGIVIMSYLILQSSALSAEFAGGTGEPNDPYQIATAEQLIAIGSDRDLLEKSFVLIADIDLDPNLPDGRVFTDALIAQDDSNSVSAHKGAFFHGILNGQGHTIANLHIEGQHGYDAGLFGVLDGLVKDLHFTDVVVSGTPCGAIAGMNGGMILRCSVTGYVSGVRDVGGLAGFSDGSLVECRGEVQVTGGEGIGGMVGRGGTLMRCEVQANVSGQQNVGGLIGSCSGLGSQINECSMTGTVIGNDNVGGLIGDSSDAIILRSSAICEINAEQTAGGLVGHEGLLLMDCYFRGSIAGSTVGGLVGKSSLFLTHTINCYAACEILPLEADGIDSLVGGIFGYKSRTPATIACFWDAELSGVTASTGSDSPLELGKGLTTEQMMDEDLLRNAGWDFSYVWMIPEGEYPKLRWEVTEDEAVSTP